MKKISILGVSFLSMIALATVLFFNSCDDDPCKDVVCVNGDCVSGVCACDLGYEGTDCSTKSVTKYVGSYSAIDVCSSGTYSYNAIVSASSTTVNGLIITNFGGFGSTLTAIATVDGNSVTVPSQSLGGVNVSGSGTLNASATQIQFTYTANDGTNSDNCTSTWDLQ
ncbi:MAG TPA: hypothetical protein PLD84_01940 [Chitinophagales bacterium]|nr:hypothetical protein [Chitinophagales bacterium]